MKGIAKRFLVMVVAIIMLSLGYGVITSNAAGCNIDGEVAKYEVNDIKIVGDDVDITGWFYLYNYKNFTDSSSTHKYRLRVGGKMYYDLRDYKVSHTKLNSFDGTVTHKYDDVGFHFKIPVSDLVKLSGKNLSLEMNFLTNSKYWVTNLIYIADSEVYTTPAYTITFNSDDLGSFKPDSTTLYVRTGPGQNYSIAKSEKGYGASFENKLHYTKNTVFSLSRGTFTGKRQRDENENSWYQVRYAESGTDSTGRARVVPNKSGNIGWISGNYVQYTGEFFNFTIKDNYYTVKFTDGQGNTLKTQSVKYGSGATAPTVPLRKGYTFTGWDKTFSSVKGDITVNAQWRKNIFYVEYDGNGNTGGTMAKTTVTYGVDTPLRKNAFTKTGYTFKGWVGERSDGTKRYKSADGSETGWYKPGSQPSGWEYFIYKDGTNINATTSKDKDTVTMIASWSRNKYTVTFENGLGTVLKTQTVYYGNDATPPTTPKRTGYTFKSWSGTYTNVTSNRTIKATWTPVNYTITYDLNGGTMSGQKTSYNIETDTFTLPIPKRTGYTFLGWTGSNGTTAQKSVSIVKGSTGNKSYKANWKVNSYTLTYNPNGGTVTPTSKKVNYGSEYGTLPTPTKTGYDFKGWYTALSGGSKVSSTTKMGAGNVTIYAQWSVKTVKVTFHRNFSSTDTVTEVQTFTYGKTGQSFSDKGWSKTGYTLLGWSFDKDATNKQYNILSGVTDAWILGNSPSADLYGVWKPNTFYVKYDGNGATSGSMTNTTVTYGVTTPLRKNAFVKTGYAFKGWVCQRSDGTRRYKSPDGSSTGFYPVGKQPSGWVEFIYPDGAGVHSSSSKNGDTVTMIAQWSIKKTVVTFHRNTSSTDTVTSNQTFTYGVSDQSFSNKGWSRTGYTLLGWSEDKNATEKTYNVLSGVSDSWLLSKYPSIDLYGVWRANTYSIVYDANSGVGTMNPSSHTYNIDKALSSNVFTKEGYTFKGWNTKANGSGTSYSNKQVVKNLSSSNGAKVTLYAQWGVNSYTNTVYHWAGGFENQEGNNSTKTMYRLGNTTFKANYNSVYTLNSNLGVAIPNGFYLVSNVGTSSIGGTWGRYPFGTKVTQKSNAMYYQYDYLPNQYKITYNLGGGKNSSANPSSYNILYGVKLQNPTRVGYKFAGWYNGNTKITGINEGKNATFTSPSEMYSELSKRQTGDITLTAKWTPITYTVKYDANGGTGAMNPSTHTYDVEKALTANSFSKVGYTFIGWNTKADGSGTKYTNSAKIKNLSTVDKAEITLYAQWKVNTFYYEFDGNAPTSGSMGRLEMTYGVSKKLPKNAFLKTGYTFQCWYVKQKSNNTWLYKNSDNTKRAWYTWGSQPDGWTPLEYADESTVYSHTSKNGDTLTLVAHWKLNSYNVTFTDGNGGILKTQKVGYGGNATAPSTPKRTGYTFIGWDKGFTNITSDITVNAKWRINTYTIRFNGNGNTGGAMSDMPMEYAVGKNMPKNTFTKTGYGFAGWNCSRVNGTWSYKSPDGKIEWYKEGFQPQGYTKTLYKDGQVIALYSFTDKEIITMVAQWNINTYTVRFEDGFGNTISTQKVNYGSSAKAPSKPIHKGYTFKGWNKDFSKITSDMVVIATWKPNTYTVKYNGNGSTSGVMLTQSMVYDKSYNLLKNSFIRTGHEFIGWNTKLDGSGVSYSDGQGVKNLVSSDGGELTLYAQWNINIYTVTFKDGNNVLDVQKVKYGYGATSPKEPHKEGYTFRGWDKDFSKITGDLVVNALWDINKFTVKFTDGMGKVLKTQVVNYGASATPPITPERKGYKFNGWDSSYTNIKNNITVNATWKPNTYTIKYDGNGADSGAMASQALTYDRVSNLSKNTFVKYGNNFLGWKDENGVSYIDGQSVTNLSDIDNDVKTLYAQWGNTKPIITTPILPNNSNKIPAFIEEGTTDIVVIQVGDSFNPLEYAKAYDKEDGDISSRISYSSTIPVSQGKVNERGIYNITYTVSDLGGLSDTKTIKIRVNDKPIVSAKDRTFFVGESISKDVILEKAEATDFEDGNLTSKIKVDIDSIDSSIEGEYVVTYSITDRYRATSKCQAKFTIVNSYSSSGDYTIRYISREHLDTLDSNSKWVKDVTLNNYLVNTLNKKTTDANAEYVIEFTNSECEEMKEFFLNNTHDSEINSKFLDRFSSIFKKRG